MNWVTKYRPKKLNQLVGQQFAVNYIQSMLAEKTIPNAILISGDTGTGKTTIARLICRYLNCQTLNACGKCPSCKIPIDQHPDYQEYNWSEARGIDDIRLIVQQAQFMPRFNIRVLVGDECHQLTTQASEALLKPLEEPPSNTLWILLTTDPQKLKPSIRGRCQEIPLKRPTLSELVGFMQKILARENVKLPNQVLEQIAQSTGCLVRHAIQLLESIALFSKSMPNATEEELLRLIDREALKLFNINQIQVAFAFLLALYTGKKQVAVRVLNDTDQYVELINRCLDLNQAAIDALAGITVNRIDHQKIVNMVKKNQVSFNQLLAVHNYLWKTRNEMYSSPKHCIVANLCYLND